MKLPFSSFTKRETDILLGRIVRDNPYNTDPRDAHLSQFQIVVSVLTDWKVWMHCSMALLGLEYSPPLGTYSPSIIKSFGYGTFNSNLLVMPNSALLIISTFALAWWSDRINSRSIPIIFAAIWLLIGLIVLDVSPLLDTLKCMLLTNSGPSTHQVSLDLLCFPRLHRWLSFVAPYQRCLVISQPAHPTQTRHCSCIIHGYD